MTALFQKLAPKSSVSAPVVPWQLRQLTTAPHCGVPAAWQEPPVEPQVFVPDA